MDDWLNLIGNTGFPIAVSAYLLIRVEAKLGQLTNAIAQLREAIITLPMRDCCMPPTTPVTPSHRNTESFTVNPPPA
ncbi:YvrJ family protein [Syntrophomonas curvata]